MHELETMTIEERLSHLEHSTEDRRVSASTEALEVKEAIVKGAAEKLWSTRFELDYGLRWDPRREVWVDESGFAYDGLALCYRSSPSPTL